MKKFILFPICAVLLVTGCNRNSSTTSQPTSEPTTSTTTLSTSSTSIVSSTSSMTSITSSISSSTTQTTTTSKSTTITSTTSPIKDIIPIGEAIKKGKSYAKDVPSNEHYYFSNEEIKISGRVIQCIAIGINQEGLTYISDGKDIISCLSGTAQNSLYYKCKDYVGLESSNYIVTGRIGFYYSNPVINVTSFEYTPSTTYSIDYDNFSYKDYSSIDEYNDDLENLEYNKKGYGEGELIVLKGVKCLAEADDNSWLFSDGNFVQGAYFQTNKFGFTVYKTYDIYGISCLYKWKPSIRTLMCKLSQEDVEVKVNEKAINTTADEMYKIGAPTEDIEKCENTNKFIRTFKYFYTATCYFNYYIANTNGYVVAGDSYYSQEITSQTAASDKHMFLFNNESFNRWQNTHYVPVKDFLLSEYPLTFYFVEYQFTKSNKRMMPQVYMFEDYIPPHLD